MNYFKKISALILFLLISLATIAQADTTVEIKNKINDKTDSIAKLEAEIKQYQADIDALGKEKDSLSNTIKSLDISKKKLETDTKITEKKISAKNLEIKNLSSQIGDKGSRISDGKRVISRSLLDIYQMNSASIIESTLGKKSFSDIWSESDQLIELQGGMQDKITDLKNVKADLEDNKKLTEKKKAELIGLTNDLKNQAKIIAQNVKEKNDLLKETKNTEANYNQILLAKQIQKQAFEKEISDLESALKFTLNPNSIPGSSPGVLKYPLDKIRITQYFGNTEFSTKNPSVYKGTGHNGIDLAASIGTPVRSAGVGTVTEVISKSTAQRCGYGKWIAIKHPNGLSTVYAHLSLPSVVVGQAVDAGQVIGYSGNTGFSTGPHLHFGVYVTQGLQTIESKSCPGIIIPYAAYNAYLNPLSYL